MFIRRKARSTSKPRSGTRVANRKMRLEALECRKLLAADVLFEDSFDFGSGSNNWNGLWTENSGGDDWFRSTQRSTSGNYSAELDSAGSGWGYLTSSPIDLSNHSNVQLSFSWYIEGTFDGNDIAALELSPDGGLNWNQVASLAGLRGLDDVWHHEVIAIGSNYLNESFQFRFAGSVDHKQEDANVDDVKITGLPIAWPEVSINDAVAIEGANTFT